MVEQIEHYFPDNDFPNFKPFDPIVMPTDPAEIEEFGRIEIEKLASDFSIGDPITIANEWTNFLNFVVQHPTFFKQRSTDPHLFGAEVLNLPETGEWPNVLKLVKTVLVILSGSREELLSNEQRHVKSSYTTH